MPINVGDRIPSVTLKHLTDAGMQDVTTEQIFKGGKVVLFSVPGAFTPTCSVKHLPGFVQQAEALKAKGVKEIVCLAVNDPFVMRAWGEKNGAEGKVFMLPDGNAILTEALGLTMDGSAFGLGKRGQRFAMIVEDGAVTDIAVEQPGQFEVSSAEAVLAKL